MKLACVILVAVVLCERAVADPPQAVRGLASHVDVEYGPLLRAKASQSPTTPVMVRVVPGDAPGRQRLEFIGAVAGAFDLRDYVERVDGRGLADLPELPVVVVSRLPADHGTDLYGSAPAGFNWRVHYRELLWTAAGLWLVVPVVVIVRRALRRRALPPPAPPARVLTLADELRAALEMARGRDLSVDERGRLELLLFRVLSDRPVAAQADAAEISREIQELREHPRTRDLVAAMERWLHTRTPGPDAHGRAAAALEEFRAAHLSQSAPAGAGAP